MRNKRLIFWTAVVAIVVGVFAVSRFLMILEFRRIVSRADSVVVATIDIRGDHSTRYHLLEGEARSRFLSRLENFSEPVRDREFASWYVIRVYLRDAQGNFYGKIAIQPGIRATSNEQMEGLTAEARLGKPVDKNVIPSRGVDWVILRKCMK